MFSKAVVELYLLREKYEEDKEIVEDIDKIILELTTGISAILDILAEKERDMNGYNEYKN